MLYEVITIGAHMYIALDPLFLGGLDQVVGCFRMEFCKGDPFMGELANNADQMNDRRASGKDFT